RREPARRRTRARAGRPACRRADHHAAARIMSDAGSATTAPATFLGKDLVGLEQLSADQIRAILDTAEAFKEISERPIKKVPVLRGKTIVNLFYEASTRTRVSFEFAEKRLSADTVNITASARKSVV